VSLAINLDTVRRVLLADGWHDIKIGSLSFDSFEAHHDDVAMEHGLTHWPLRAGRAGDVSAMGFRFTRRDDGTEVTGPLTSLLALENPT
jgi:hypothetical protein